MALELFTWDGFFHPSLIKFSIINSYSTKGASNNTRTVPPDLVFPCLPHPTLTLGDLNLHHPTTDPLSSFKQDDLASSTPNFDMATELGFSLLNPPGVYINLPSACPLVVPFLSEWSDPLPLTGSDHIPILIRFDAPLFHHAPPSPNWALTDWPALEADLKALIIPSPPARPTSRSMGIWFYTNFTRGNTTLAVHILLKIVTHRSMP